MKQKILDWYCLDAVENRLCKGRKDGRCIEHGDEEDINCIGYYELVKQLEEFEKEIRNEPVHNVLP